MGKSQIETSFSPYLKTIWPGSLLRDFLWSWFGRRFLWAVVLDSPLHVVHLTYIRSHSGVPPQPDLSRNSKLQETRLPCPLKPHTRLAEQGRESVLREAGMGGEGRRGGRKAVSYLAAMHLPQHLAGRVLSDHLLNNLTSGSRCAIPFFRIKHFLLIQIQTLTFGSHVI